MHITLKQIAKQLTSSWQIVDDLLINLNVLKTLLALYWKLVYNENFLKFLHSINPDLEQLAKFLYKIWKRSNKDIKSLIVLIKQEYPNYKKSFIIKSSNSVKKDILEKLKNKFWDIEVDEIEVDNWVFVKWEWYFYKRFIDLDIDKLLK